MKRYYVYSEKRSLKYLVIQCVVCFVLFLISSIVFVGSTVSNLYIAEAFISIPFYVFISFMLIPFLFSGFFISIDNIFRLFKQEKERKLAVDDDI